MVDPVPVAADDVATARTVLARFPAPAAGWEIVPEGLADRRTRNRRVPSGRLPAVTIRDTRATGPVAEARQCMVCGSPVARIEDRGPKGGGSRVWPCGCSEQDAAGGVLSAEVVIRGDRFADMVAWLVAWGADDVSVSKATGLPWLVRWDAMAGGLVFVTP